METLIKMAMEALEKNPLINELELAEGQYKVRVVRNAPVITCWNTSPWTSWTYSYQVPQY